MKKEISFNQNLISTGITFILFAGLIFLIKTNLSVEVSGKELQKERMTRKLSPLGDLESHNIVLQLKKENVLSGFYGIQKPFLTLAFHVDEPVVFKELIDQALPRVN